jgi:hypothetical protein
VVAVESGVVTAVDAPPEAMMAGFRAVFAGSAALAVAAMLTSLVGRPRDAAPLTEGASG